MPQPSEPWLFSPLFAPSFIQRWWQLHERLGGTGGILFGALRDPLGLEPQLVALSSVVESYDRIVTPDPKIAQGEHDRSVAQMLASITDDQTREHYALRLAYANEPSQGARFRRMLKRAGKVVAPLGRKPNRLAEVVGLTRNYFVHLDERGGSVLRGIDLYDANQLLRVTLESTLLLDLGVPLDQVRAGVGRAHVGQTFGPAYISATALGLSRPIHQLQRRHRTARTSGSRQSPGSVTVLPRHGWTTARASFQTTPGPP